MSTTLAAAILVAGMRMVASHEYAEGAPLGYSGGFKEDTCHACHFHEPLNAEGGKVTIDGVPATFEPGARYTLTITLTRTSMKRAGFQLTARFKNGGGQAGPITPGADDVDRVSVGTAAGVQYAGQKVTGSDVGGGDSARWIVEWTAPSSLELVVFHVAANAADGNGSADGDFIYTASVDSSP